MGTSATLAVIQGSKNLVLYTSYDGYPSNVLARLAGAIISGGLDSLRRNFANATIVPESETEESDEESNFRVNAAAYIEACEGRQRPVFDEREMLHYDFGIPDFSHAGGGLIFGPKHICSAENFLNDPKNPRAEADFIVDLDAGTLLVTYDPKWTLDLTALEGKDAKAVADILENFNYDWDDEGDLTLEEQTVLSKRLNDALSAAPNFDTNTSPEETVAPVLMRRGRGDTGDSQAIYQFHPSEFFLARLTLQAFQQAERATPTEDLKRLMAGVKMESTDDHVGVFFEQVPASLKDVMKEVGARLVAQFGAHHISLNSSGGFSVIHPGGGYSSSGFIGSHPGGSLEGKEGDDHPYRPKPENLSAPRSFEARATLRQGWLENLQKGTAGEAVTAHLRSELFIAQASLDPEAYHQLQSYKPLMGIPPDFENGLGGLTAAMAQIESVFNQANLQERWKAFSSDDQNHLLEQLDTLGRRQFEMALGLPSRRPKGP